MLIIFSVFGFSMWVLKFKFSPGFIFAGLNFMNFFYNHKKQDIKDMQN